MNQETKLIPLGTECLFVDTKRDMVFKGSVYEDNGGVTVGVEYIDEGERKEVWILRERVLNKVIEVIDEYDFINPTHYQNSGGKETIEMMLDIWGVESVIAHCQMCAFKYRMRLGKKPEQPIERDLEKAQWYENKANELLEL